MLLVRVMNARIKIVTGRKETRGKGMGTRGEKVLRGTRYRNVPRRRIRILELDCRSSTLDENKKNIRLSVQFILFLAFS